MTNKIYSMVDGKRIGIAPNLTPRLHRVDSVSILSRQSLLPILLLCLTLFLGVGNAWGVVMDFTSLCSANETPTSKSVSPITMTIDNTNATNDAKYFSNGTALRFYNGCKVTFSSSSGNITKIVFASNSNTAFTSSGATANVGNFDGAEWTGNAAAVEFSVSTTIRISTATITTASATKYKVTLKDNNIELEQTTAGANITLPLRAGCTGYTFAGWTASWEEEQDEWTSTSPVIISAGAYLPTANISLYPVYTKVITGTPKKQTLSFTYSSHAGWNLSSTIDKNSYYLLQKNSYVESPTIDDLGSITSIVIGVGTFSNKGNGIVSDGTTTYESFSPAGNSNGSITLQPETNPLSGSGKIRIVNTDGSSYTTTSSQQKGTRFYSMTINYETTGDVTYYISEPNCCNPLGSINGSVSFTNVSPTSVTVGVPSDYSDKDNANLEGYIFKRYAASTGGDALETIETDAANKTTATFNTGLVANTTYYYSIIAKHSSSSCNSAETSPRKSHKIDSYVVSYANGGGSGTNPGAHDHVLANGTVNLKSNTFDAPTGKEFKAWNDGTKDYDEGEEYTVTENTVMTAQWQCMEPGFTKNLSTTQVDYLQGETAAKLSVTAAANGAELSYAWEMSANGTTGWSSVGTNSNEYTPSTATAGDQYYHCIVTNLVDGCTDSKATSAVAHIHVDVPAACLQPSISVASGTYYEDKTVTITCGTVGAAIYYTTDGSTTPTSGSTLYEGAITVDHSMTIKAIAIKAGMDNSTVAEATYTIKCETPTIVLAAGNYTGVQTTTITKGYGTNIYYTTDGSTPSNTNGTEYTGAVSIDQPMTLKAIVWKDGCTNSEVASAAYTLKCTTPTFNKETDTYTGAQSITLSSTAGADIYYTLDGTAPSKTNGTKYTAAIEVSANQTVKAIAVKEGWGDSEIASATYTIQYNVYWWVNGVAWNDKGGSTLVTYGQTATAPTTAPTKADGCGDKFMGWTETQNYESDDTAPTDMFTETSAAITKETNFYAVFADYGE